MHSFWVLFFPVLVKDISVIKIWTQSMAASQTFLPWIITPGNSCKIIFNWGNSLDNPSVTWPVPPPMSQTVVSAGNFPQG